jgi:hypothetical protein
VNPVKGVNFGRKPKLKLKRPIPFKVICALKMHPQKRKEKSAKKRRSKGDTKSKSKSDDISERNLIHEYNSLEIEEREVLADRGLTNCLELLVDSFDSGESIAQRLTEIDESHDSEIHRYEAEDEAENGEKTNHGPPMDLVSSILAVSAVQEHLRERGTVSIALERLKLALISTLHGTPPAMLIGPTLSHRAPDTTKILEIKGILAAAMHEYQRRDKLSRVDAARAVLKNISPDLKIHLSRQKITIRMIQNWRDLFGAVSAKPGPGNDSYKQFKKAFASNPESHDKYIQYLTADYARSLPSL